ncbi:hypothetical protein V1509DRAFT_71629 [Lipomyces kononenkoae]
MSPPSGGVLVKNEIQSRKTTRNKSGTATPASGTGSDNINSNNDDDDNEGARQGKRARVSSDDPYASLRTQLSSLAKNPNKEIIIPRPKSPSELIPPPPELVTNVQGSSAGAGSGEFHVYKQARRREMERTKLFEEQREKEKTLKEFEEHREQMRMLDDQRTSKNREKRRKRGKSGKGSNDKKPSATDEAEEAGKQGENDLPESTITSTQQESAAVVPAIDSEINLTIIDDFAM